MNWPRLSFLVPQETFCAAARGAMTRPARRRPRPEPRQAGSPIVCYEIAARQPTLLQRLLYLTLQLKSSPIALFGKPPTARKERALEPKHWSAVDDFLVAKPKPDAALNQALADSDRGGLPAIMFRRARASSSTSSRG